jgi:RNA polymerase sigma factor (sigma-70 family)
VSDFDPQDLATTDETLVAWIAVGSNTAVETLIRRYEKPLMAVLIRASGNRQAAEDLFQETWIRVVRSAARFDPSLPFRPWLFKIAWNVLRTDLDRSSRRRETPIDGVFEVASDSKAVDDEVLQRDEYRRTRQLIAALPPKLAETLMLRYFEELTEKEVALRLGVPVGTVKSRLHNALRRLALALGEAS